MGGGLETAVAGGPAGGVCLSDGGACTLPQAERCYRDLSNTTVPLRIEQRNAGGLRDCQLGTLINKSEI